MSVKAVVFDLDDTLYNQSQHLAGAFFSVGRLLKRRFNLDPLEVKDKLLSYYRIKGSSSGKLLDAVLENYGVKPEKELINQMISAFYSYKPTKLKPYKGALSLLMRIKERDLKLGVLTNGNPKVQREKIVALGLNEFFDQIIVTDDFGREFRKPSTRCFLEIAHRLKVNPRECIYVGDNPEKDFVGAREVGMMTVRVFTGEYRKIKVEKELEAEKTIRRLEDLEKILDVM